MSSFLKSNGFLTEDEEAEELSKSKRTLQNWRKLGIGPAWTTDAGGTPYYKREWNLEYFEARKRQPVRQERPARDSRRRVERASA